MFAGTRLVPTDLNPQTVTPRSQETRLPTNIVDPFEAGPFMGGSGARRPDAFLSRAGAARYSWISGQNKPHVFEPIQGKIQSQLTVTGDRGTRQYFRLQPPQREHSQHNRKERHHDFHQKQALLTPSRLIERRKNNRMRSHP